MERLGVYTDRLQAERRARTFVRAAVCQILAFHTKSYTRDVINRCYLNERDRNAIEIVTRAAASPQSMSDTALVQTAVSDFINSLGSASAAAPLLQMGVQLSFDGSGSILVQDMAATAANVTFLTSESGVVPVRQFATGSTNTILMPRKLITINGFTREILNHSLPNIEVLVRDVLAQSFGMKIDALLFGTAADDGTSPAGLRYNIAAGTASTSTIPSEACMEDVANITGTVAAVAGNSPIVIIASAKQAQVLKLRRVTDSYPVFASSGLADKIVMAVATNCLASAVSPDLEFRTSDAGAIHMDTAATQLITAGPAIATPVRSPFQTDTIMLKTFCQMAWGLRSTTGAAWLSAVLW